MTILSLDFNKALTALTIGSIVTLKSIEPEPSPEQIEMHRLWSAWNFTGQVVAIDTVLKKIDIEKTTEMATVVYHLDEKYTGLFEVDSTQLVVSQGVDDALKCIINENHEKQEITDEPSPYRRMVILLTWMELQDFRANSPNIIALTVEERAKRIPFIQALKIESGLTWAELDTAIENRLWPIVRRTALFEARCVVAKQNVTSAATVDDKITATDISFTE
jgi:hypothetical protein